MTASVELLSSETFARHGGAPLHGGAIYTTAALLAEGEPEKDVRREQANRAIRELAFALALELDAGYR